MSSHKKGIWAWLCGCDLSDSLDKVEAEVGPKHRNPALVEKYGNFGFADQVGDVVELVNRSPCCTAYNTVVASTC